MEKMGNPVLESVDDLMNVFASVKKQYPEMIVYLPYWAYTSAISDWMGVSKSAYEKDGRIYNGINNPDWLEYRANAFSSRIKGSGVDYINQMYD